MSVEDIRLRWAKWNLQRMGKDRSVFSGVWYRGDTLFSGYLPAARILFNKDGKSIALNAGLGIGVGNGTGTWVGNKQVKGQDFDMTMCTPCIGVFTRFEQDCMPAETLHRRLHFLWGQQFKEYLTQYKEDKPSNFSDRPDIYTNKVIDNLKRVEDDRRVYSKFFSLGWEKIDVNDWRGEVYDWYRTAADIYNMPQNVNKRERAAARRTAKKAFGIS
jgi:hypothetical protein